MSRKPIDALKRADRTVLGALALIFVTVTAAWAYVPRTEQRAPASSTPPSVALTLGALQPDTPVPTARPAVLPNAVRVIAAPTQDEVSAVARVVDNPQTQCLAEALYYEARGEGVAGQKAVAEVVFNRMRSGLFPRSICGVITEDAGGTCQFSFECDRQIRAAKEPYEWVRARVLAAAIVSGVVKLGDETDGAVAYHATYVNPDWGYHLTRTVKIGDHIFYKFTNSRWLTRGA
jgi:N-acetylmuramoyl-L-alanine amidase